MIFALAFMAIVGWGCWLWLRDPASPLVTTPVTAPGRQITGPVWTSLDELQLTRLLDDATTQRKKKGTT